MKRHRKNISKLLKFFLKYTFSSGNGATKSIYIVPNLSTYNQI